MIAALEARASTFFFWPSGLTRVLEVVRKCIMRLKSLAKDFRLPAEISLNSYFLGVSWEDRCESTLIYLESERVERESAFVDSLFEF
jgi:hypothetical protein